MTQTLRDYDIISRLPRLPEKRTVRELQVRLGAAGQEITARSLQRRLQSMSKSHPVVCDTRSKPFGWSISGDKKIAMGEVSVQEAVALKLCERYLSGILPTDVLEDLKSYFNQAEARLRQDSLYKAWLEKVRIFGSGQALVKPSVPRHLHARAFEGVLKGLALKVEYQAVGRERATTSTIHPLAIVVRGMVTYLIARNPKFSADDNIVWLALHRIQSITVTGESFSEPGFDLDAHIAGSSLGFKSQGKALLRVRFHDGAGRNLLDTPLLATQRTKICTAETCELTVRLAITEPLKWWLFGFGDHAEVLSPKSLRNEFRDRLARACKRYGE